MNYTIHKLNSENHSHIIGRQDSVTGDKVNENDKVVFCGACQSVFLVESWEYMNAKHCNQTQTLDSIPTILPTLIAQKKPRAKNEDAILVTEFSSKELEGVVNILPVCLLSGLTDMIANSENPFIWSMLLIATSVILAGGLQKIMNKDKVRKFLKLDKKTIRIFETGIELQNDKFYSYQEIQKIEYIREDYPNFFYHCTKKYLVIHLKSGEIIKQKVPSKSYLATKPLFFALTNAAKFTELHFQTKDKNELGLAQSIERNYTGSIFIRQNYPQIENRD